MKTSDDDDEEAVVLACLETSLHRGPDYYNVRRILGQTRIFIVSTSF